MRGHEADEFARRNHCCFLPESREMPRVAGHKVVSTSSVSTFQKFIVLGVGRHLKQPRGHYSTRAALDELYELLADAFPNLKLGPREHFLVLGNDGIGGIEVCEFGECKQEYSPREPLRLQSR